MMAIPAVIAEGEKGGLEAKGKKSGTYSNIIYSLYEIRIATERTTIFRRNTA